MAREFGKARTKHMKRMKRMKRMEREWAAMRGASLWGAGTGAGSMTGSGMFARLARNPPSQQFMLGAALGAAAVYVLGDEHLRGKLLKAGMNLYASVMGGIEEIKEQAADIQAEMQAEMQNETQAEMHAETQADGADAR